MILGTSNCLQQPLPGYADRIYTTGIAGLEGVPHTDNDNYETLIKHALRTPKMRRRDGGYIITGYHHKNVLPLMDRLVNLIHDGRVRHVFVIGGCDAPSPNMSYYDRLTELVPKDAIILTAACGKHRYNRRDYGDIEGIPRFMDFGQCNSVYSIIKVVAELSRRLGEDLSKLPLSIVLSWMEQKAVGIPYALLYLGIKGIYLGPKLPEFLTPNVLKILQKEFDLRTISGDPERDLNEMLREGSSVGEDSPLK